MPFFWAYFIALMKEYGEQGVELAALKGGNRPTEIREN
jgi:hypothetical protein